MIYAAENGPALRRWISIHSMIESVKDGRVVPSFLAGLQRGDKDPSLERLSDFQKR
jgi:hypothetical protein